MFDVKMAAAEALDRALLEVEALEAIYGDSEVHVDKEALE